MSFLSFCAKGNPLELTSLFPSFSSPKVPCSSPKFLAKSLEDNVASSDTIIYDLEDSVPISRKKEAREDLVHFLKVSIVVISSLLPLPLFPFSSPLSLSLTFLQSLPGQPLPSNSSSSPDQRRRIRLRGGRSSVHLLHLPFLHHLVQLHSSLAPQTRRPLLHSSTTRHRDTQGGSSCSSVEGGQADQGGERRKRW